MNHKKDALAKKAAKAAGSVAAKKRLTVNAETPQREGKLPKKHNTGLPRRQKKAAGKAAAARAAKLA